MVLGSSRRLFPRNPLFHPGMPPLYMYLFKGMPSSLMLLPLLSYIERIRIALQATLSLFLSRRLLHIPFRTCPILCPSGRRLHFLDMNRCPMYSIDAFCEARSHDHDTARVSFELKDIVLFDRAIAVCDHATCPCPAQGPRSSSFLPSATSHGSKATLLLSGMLSMHSSAPANRTKSDARASQSSYVYSRMNHSIVCLAILRRPCLSPSPFSAACLSALRCGASCRALLCSNEDRSAVSAVTRPC